MDINSIINSLSPVERKVIPYLKDNISVKEIVSNSNLLEIEVIRALQWLENKKIVKINIDHRSTVKLDKNGILYLSKEIPEKRLLKILKKRSSSIEEFRKFKEFEPEELNYAIGSLKKNGAIIFENKSIKITDKGIALVETNFNEELLLKKIGENTKFLDEFSKIEKLTLEGLKKRTLFVKLDVTKVRNIQLTDLGKSLIKHSSKLKQEFIESLTSSMIISKNYIGKTFRHYDIKGIVPKVFPGKKHFVNETIEYIKRIWLDLGFKEMTGNHIDSCFWNFDALFTPQDHPARDMQDTLFVEGYDNLENSELLKRIKTTHENGWTTGSLGWRYKWDIEQAKKLVARTHTTVLSSRTIANLKKEDIPIKFFAVGKVFRNETLDKTHLFEFYQTEGIVIDKNANFKNLIGYLKTYFSKMGFNQIRLRPAYFPYTEPSLEIDIFHPVHKKWIELGGSGIFRPEVVKPLLGIEIPVLAWGLSVERLITDYYGFTDLRDLYSNDLKKLRSTKVWIK